MCALVAACANPGQGPDGGPYDETPPTVTLLSPQMGERDVKKIKKVTLGFSEAIKVENPSEKIVVSPPQHEQPEIKISGKRITVELVDSLLPNTTYTNRFSDAIKDATEGNPLGNFHLLFLYGRVGRYDGSGGQCAQRGRLKSGQRYLSWFAPQLVR